VFKLFRWPLGYISAGHSDSSTHSRLFFGQLSDTLGQQISFSAIFLLAVQTSDIILGHVWLVSVGFSAMFHLLPLASRLRRTDPFAPGKLLDKDRVWLLCLIVG
jgi:hypothetical protein